MNICSWMRDEQSGLRVTTLEIAKYTERAGHSIVIKQPTDGMPIYGNGSLKPDLHTVHSQISPSTYFDNKPKILWCHGEPLSSVANGISMRAFLDLAQLCDACICMRKEEWPIWNTIKRTHLVQKGIDLERYYPIKQNVPEKLSGSPAVLYYENWRGIRNPLYPLMAMAQVWSKLPNARLHLYNVTDKKMLDTFKMMIQQCHLTTYVRTLQGPVDDVNTLLNRADIVVSGLFPLYARGIEAFGAGKAFIAPGYREDGYPWTCELDVDSIAAAILRCWENYDTIDYRQWAHDRHNVQITVNQALRVYERYLN